jgi:hypothetical protein
MNAYRKILNKIVANPIYKRMHHNQVRLILAMQYLTSKNINQCKRNTLSDSRVSQEPLHNTVIKLDKIANNHHFKAPKIHHRQTTNCDKEQ